MRALFCPNYYTLERDEYGPRFNRGSGGGARGCGFKERGGAHARTEGGHFLLPPLSNCLVSVCPRCRNVALGLSKKSLGVRLGESRNQLRGLREGG